MVLLAAPTSIYKEYVLFEWIEHIKRLTYKNIEILLVDNSRSEERRVGKECPM